MFAIAIFVFIYFSHKSYVEEFGDSQSDHIKSNFQLIKWPEMAISHANIVD